MTVGLSVATMYGNVQNFVWLPWQPFKSRHLISWGLFVTTTRRNPELLVHNQMPQCFDGSAAPQQVILGALIV